MKIRLALAIPAILLLVIFYSCQKEFSFENGQYGRGVLLKDGAGNCFPVAANGLYRINTVLNDSNSLQVTLHMTQAGSVSISSDTVNGYSFSYTGNTSDTGLVTVVLKGNGRPVRKGTDHFSIRFDSTECIAAVNVIDPNGPASYILSGNGTTCMNDSVYGAFIKNEEVGFSSNQVAIELLVRTTGPYQLHTDTVNGVSFAGSGFLTTTGLDTVVMYAHGTPLQAGNFTYHVYADSSACSFMITVYIPVVATNPDLFPLTYASQWNYANYVFFGATVQRSITDSSIINGKQYKKMHEVVTPGATTDYFFRKQTGDYFEYGNADAYTRTISFSPAIKADILFLKEFMTSGETWYSDLYTGPVSFGQSINMRYHFFCLEANVNAVVNGKAFSHVYKVLMVPQVAAAGVTPGDSHENWVFWYARGVGLIYSSYQTSMINSFTVN